MNVETLERGRLLSVTVSRGYPGFYEIYGDAGANSISISVSMAAQTFTLNGSTYGGVEYVAVDGLGGDDTITLSAFAGPGYMGAGISGGDGNDLIDASDNHFRVVIRGGNGNDTIYGSAYDDQLYGDAGDDVLYGNGGYDSIFA